MDRFDPRHTFPIKVEAARHENLNSSQLYNTKSITQTTGHSNASVITGNPFVKEDPDPFEAEIARWIPVCRERLKKRERTLTELRLSESCKIVKRSLQQFAEQNNQYFINLKLKRSTPLKVQRMDRTNREVMVKYLNEQIIRQMIEQYSLTVNQSLNRWEGVQRSLKFKKGKPMAIESYFKTAKNWFDQHKIEFLSEMCWTPLFKALHQLSLHAAAQFFQTSLSPFPSLQRRFSQLQGQYEHYLHLLLLHNMMRSTVSLSNAGKKLLIPARALVKVIAKSETLQRLSRETNNALGIRKKTNREVRDCMITKCQNTLALCRRNFEQTLCALHQYTGHLDFVPPTTTMTPNTFPLDTTTPSTTSIMNGGNTFSGSNGAIPCMAPLTGTSTEPSAGSSIGSKSNTNTNTNDTNPFASHSQRPLPSMSSIPSMPSGSIPSVPSTPSMPSSIPSTGSIPRVPTRATTSATSTTSGTSTKSSDSVPTSSWTPFLPSFTMKQIHCTRSAPDPTAPPPELPVTKLADVPSHRASTHRHIGGQGNGSDKSLKLRGQPVVPPPRPPQPPRTISSELTPQTVPQSAPQSAPHCSSNLPMSLPALLASAFGCDNTGTSQTQTRQVANGMDVMESEVLPHENAKESSPFDQITPEEIETLMKLVSRAPVTRCIPQPVPRPISVPVPGGISGPDCGRNEESQSMNRNKIENRLISNFSDMDSRNKMVMENKMGLISRKRDIQMDKRIDIQMDREMNTRSDIQHTNCHTPVLGGSNAFRDDRHHDDEDSLMPEMPDHNMTALESSSINSSLATSLSPPEILPKLEPKAEDKDTYTNEHVGYGHHSRDVHQVLGMAKGSRYNPY